MDANKDFVVPGNGLFDVLDFELAAEHMEALNGLNDGTRVREDPLTYTGI